MTLAYVGLLLWLDWSKGLLSRFVRLFLLLPALMYFALASYLARYARWYWLLARAGAVIPPVRGFLFGRKRTLLLWANTEQLLGLLSHIIKRIMEILTRHGALQK